ncbi:M61 family metallopeptidase [Pseudoxanthomonas composti]|uniref:M61 family peptidase n=1 Tax=Pseudoxanthomonas composti TaxID=2137479 RepID=A0A4Q1JZI5_9GAMM|nr:tetratricopeptide repeat protein [Pseudoxanthomonas composti]RXR08843.1 M61 family peptidase [Pseudoxanthomonas composti]
MKMRVLAAAVLLWTTTQASAQTSQTPAPKDVDYPGTVKLEVDATDTLRRVFRVRETIPVQPGPVTLLYPEWIPGNHRPSGQIEKLAGLVITANGKRLEWTRDQYDVYAFKVEVPQGVTELVAEFQYLSPLAPAQGRVVMTPSMLNLQWNLTTLYPAGYYASRIPVQATVKLPAGWSYATALETDSKQGDTVNFRTLNFEHLQDSPMFAGRYYKRVDLDPGAKQPIHLNLFADEAKSLEAKPEQIKAHAALVEQADKLYGARHYDHYEFLLALTSQLGGIGLEHHRSSENSGATGYFTDWDKTWSGRDLLAHEYNHSWNGKFRRGKDLATPNFNVPMGDSLLWLYEGQTQFYGNVLAARSGLWTKEQALTSLALTAATYDKGRPGLSWRALQDTTNDPTINQRKPQPYRNWQLSEDYYSGGLMVWLEADAKLRELSEGKRSLDDFAKAFFGMDNGRWTVKPYDFEEVVATLNGIAAYDWSTFLRSRVDGHDPLTGGLEASGWKLVYNDKPNDAVKAAETRGKSAMLTYSLGLMAGGDGEVGDVLWDGPAFKAGVAPGMKIVAVNGMEYSSDALKDAVTAAKGTTTPIELLVKRWNRYDTFRIDYHEGLKYPSLQRIEGKPDTLSLLLKAK